MAAIIEREADMSATIRAGVTRAVMAAAWVPLAFLLTACVDNSDGGTGPVPNTMASPTAGTGPSSTADGPASSSGTGDSSTADGPASASGTGDTAPTSTVPTEALLNVAALQDYSDEGSTLIWTAKQSAIGQCMAERGFEYTLLPAVSRSSLGNLAVSPFAVDAAIARAVGYHTNLLPGLQDATREQDAAAAMNEAATESAAEFGDALDGAEGCAKIAEALVFGDAGSAVALYREQFGLVLSDVNDRLLASESIAESVEAWQTCMSAAGYAYERPAAVTSEFLANATVTSEEVAAAIADVDCQDAAGYDQALATEQDAAIREWLANNPTFLNDLAAAKNLDVARAQSYISGRE